MKQKILAIILLILAIAYIVMPYDFDKLGVMGYVDDFFLFMAAFVFLNGSFQKSERKYIRKQLFMIAGVFALLAVLAAFVLSLMK